jgi:chromosome segregation ATPase
MLSSPSAAQSKASLKAKSEALDGVLAEFARATSELSQLEKRLQEAGTPRKPSSSSGNTRVSLATQFEETTKGGFSSSQAVKSVSMTMVLDESAAELDVQLENLREDLDRLRAKESLLSLQHNNSRDGLQEAWDKLVNLRTHISLFKSSIEEATLELVAEGVASGQPASASGELESPVGKMSVGLAIREKLALKLARALNTPIQDLFFLEDK